MEKRPLCWPLDQFIDQKLVIEMTGNRQVCGILKGYDQVGNAVLSDCEELAPVDGAPLAPPRLLGTAVVRSPHILAINRVEESDDQ